VIVSELETGAVVALSAPLEVKRTTPWWLIPLGGFGALSSGAGFVLWRRTTPKPDVVGGSAADGSV
jgi:hypothetical protein